MIKNYFKTAIRNLSRNRAYLILNSTGLILGIGCAVIIFALISYHLSFDNFHSNKESIYRIVTEKHRDVVAYDIGVPSPLGVQFRKDYAYAEKVARICVFENSLITVFNHSLPVKFKELEGAAFVESEFFDIFNFKLISGDVKSALSQPHSVVITKRLAQKYFNTDNPIGKTIRLDSNLNLEVKGILQDIPANTDFRNELYISFTTVKDYNAYYSDETNWGSLASNMNCYTKFRPNVFIPAIEAELFKYSLKYRKGNKNVHHYKLQPLSDMHFNPNYQGVIAKSTLWVLSSIGLFLIIIACFNFVNLATAQAINRSKEIGIRKVLGSNKRQLFWQFMTETAIITVASVSIGLGLAIWLMPFVNALFETKIVWITIFTKEFTGFILFLIVTITLIAGAYPAIVQARFQPIKAIKGKLSQQSIGGVNVRKTLIVSQFVIAQILIICMIVVARQMYFARKIDLGFNKEAVVLVPVGSKDNKQTALKERFLELSGVQSVTLCTDAPASIRSNNGTNMRFESRTEPENFRFINRAADADYVKTFQLEMVAGRNLLPSDTVKEFLVNEMLAKKMNMTPAALIGKNIQVYGRTAPIAGVVKDFQDLTIHSEIRPLFIAPFREQFDNYAIRININSAQTTVKAIEKVWSQMYPELIFESQFLDEQLATFYKSEESLFQMIQIFTLLAIFISSLGLYGLVSYISSQRRKEIGVRKILGSSISQILWIFIKEFSKLIIFSFLLAAPLAWFIMRQWLQNFAYRIDLSPLIFVLAIAITFFIALVTISFQAVKAAIANPIKSLRTE